MRQKRRTNLPSPRPGIQSNRSPQDRQRRETKTTFLHRGVLPFPIQRDGTPFPIIAEANDFPRQRADQTKKLQPPEAVWHSEGCCSPQNDFRIARYECVRNGFFKKTAQPTEQSNASQATARSTPLQKLISHSTADTCLPDVFANALIPWRSISGISRQTKICCC
jgi:hypothetical protein